MPNDPNSHQSDSAICSFALEMMSLAGGIPASKIAKSVDISTEGGSDIVVRRLDGTRVESIEALQLALGLRPLWRRPVIAGHELSEREELVRLRTAQGRTTRQIAEELRVSDRTVTTLRLNLREHSPADVASAGSRGISVLGRPGLTRDLVHAALDAHREDVNPSGIGYLDDRVRVLVAPTPRVLSVTGSARLVIIGVLPDGVSMLDAVRAGAVAQLPISTSVAAMQAAVDRAVSGVVSMLPHSVQQLVDEICVGGRPARLTEREVHVVEGIRLGESVKQTARRLGLSAKTIENRRHQLFVKFGVRSARELDRAVGPLR